MKEGNFLRLVALFLLMFLLTSCKVEDFENKVYTVTFKNEEGHVIDIKTIVNGSKIELPIPTEKEGHIFIGWFYGVDINDQKASNQDVIAQDTEIFSRYIAKTFIVSFVDYDNSLLYTESVRYGQNANPPMNPSRKGYTFIGWDQDHYSVISNTVIKAVYEINLYTVKFINQENNETIELEQEYLTVIDLIQPTIENKIFVGWSDENDIYMDQYLVLNDTELTAIWVDEVYYQISFDTVGGEEVEPMTVLTYDYIKEVPVPIKEDFTFIGWTFSEDLISFPFRYTYGSNIVLKAIWKPMTKGLLFNIENDEVSIIKYLGSETEIIIPDTIGGYPVKQINAGAFKNNSTLTKIIVGLYVSKVGDEAFKNMLNLESIEFSNETQIFGISTFKNTNKLTNITLSSEAEYDLKYYFGNKNSFISTSLKRIIYSNGGNFIARKLTQGEMANAELILANDQTIIEPYTFSDAIHLKKIVIPNNIKEIGSHAFAYSGLQEVIFLENSQLSNIGYRAFNGAEHLEKIDFPESLKSIEGYAFNGTKKLISIYIPKEVNYISPTAFYSENLSNIIVDENNKNFRSVDGVLYNENLSELKRYPRGKSEKSFIVLNDTTIIGEHAFSYVTQLTNITLSNNITKISPYSFYATKNLIKIVIPDSVDYIGEWAFSETENLTKFVVNDQNSNFSSINGVLYNKEITKLIKYPEGKEDQSFDTPEGVIEIGDYAFAKNIFLKKVHIPKSVVQLGEWSFYDSINLTNITFENNSTLIKIGDAAFYGTINLESINIPPSVTSIGEWAFIGASSLKSITLPEGIKSIEPFTFSQTTSLKTVNIPNSVSYIGNSAFSGASSLENINIPSSVSYIGNYAFSGANSLKKIVLSENLRTMGKEVFRGARNLDIFINMESAPSGWDQFWDEHNSSVYWLGTWFFDVNGEPTPNKI